MKKRTYTDKPLGDTEWLLEQWGSWRMEGMGVPRYVSPSLEAAGTMSGITYTLTDDAALVVDAAVARLIKRNQQMGDFVWLYFGAKWTAIRIGEQNRMAERKAREIIKVGVAWIDCALEELRDGCNQKSTATHLAPA